MLVQIKCSKNEVIILVISIYKSLWLSSHCLFSTGKIP